MVGAVGLLIVDDDPDLGALIQEIAEDLGFNTMVVREPERTIQAFRSLRPKVVILDLMMPGKDGIQILQQLADEECECDLVIFSGADSRVINTTARLAAWHGLPIKALLRKPIEVDDLVEVLEKLREPEQEITEDELRSALTDGMLSVHYQPKVNLHCPREWLVEGVECLARWIHPEKGMIPPDAFISLAERTGLIADLSDTIVDQALRFAGNLRRSGHELDIAVNFSAQSLSDPGLPDRLARKLAEHELYRSRLIIEITESAAMANEPKIMENLTRFRLKGMHLSMDDFGTGYSSLVQLHRMPFSELKIDKSFVLEAEADQEAQIIIRSITALAHNLGLRVCAEGVESHKSLRLLRSIGCEQAQGFLMSAPLPAEDLERFIVKQSRAGVENGAPMVRQA